MTVKPLDVYWVGKTFYVVWPIVDPVTGDPVTDSTLSGEVKQPNGVTAAMTAEHDSDGNGLFSFEPTMPGQHAYDIASTGTAEGAEQGYVLVLRDLLGLPPIELDPTTTVGTVRLLATDTYEHNPLFTDAEISRFLSLAGSNVFKAAAMAVERMAISEALISKKITTQDLQTDGPAVADALRKLAAQLREDAATDPDGANGFAVEIIPYRNLDTERGWY
jgi:hypothetical protein